MVLRVLLLTDQRNSITATCKALSLPHIWGHQPTRVLEETVALGGKDSERQLLQSLCAAFRLREAQPPGLLSFSA